MYDLVELERKWHIYNSERKRKYTLAIFGLCGLCVFAILFGYYMVTSDDKPTSVQSALVVAKAITPPVITQDFNVTPQAKPTGAKVLSLTLPEIKTEPQTQRLPVSQELQTMPTNISSLQKRYDDAKNYDNAIELAKAYFNAGAFEKARKYAIDANSFDALKDEGWIIFAKSSVKLGSKTDAIDALAKYNQTSKSTATKELERELRQK